MSVDNQPTSDRTGLLDRVSRYDLLLAVLPTPLTAGLVIGAVSEVPSTGATALGGLLAALLVAYGLFVDAPVEPSGGDGARGV